MVRRRTASPKPSGPVRSASPPFSRSPMQTAPAPMGARPGAGGAHGGPQGGYGHPPPPAASQGPGLMGQMAATAGGVAIGSAVGHTIGHMMTGGGGSSEAAPAAAPQQYSNGQPQQQPCEIEWRQFLECSQSQNDLNVCQAYSDLFKQCKSRFNMS